MKNKFSNGALSCFLSPRIHRNVLAWAKSTSVSEGSNHVNETIRRLEEDGGRMLDLGKPIAGSNLETAEERADE